MLIGIDSSPCSLSLRNRSTLCSTTKCHQNKSDLENDFVQKSFFRYLLLFQSQSCLLESMAAIFRQSAGYIFNPNHAYWNQWRLFSGNLPGMFSIPIMLIGINSGYFRAICRVCLHNSTPIK